MHPVLFEFTERLRQRSRVSRAARSAADWLDGGRVAEGAGAQAVSLRHLAQDMGGPVQSTDKDGFTHDGRK